MVAGEKQPNNGRLHLAVEEPCFPYTQKKLKVFFHFQFFKCTDSWSETGLDYVSDEDTITKSILLFCSMTNKITKSHDC